MHPPIRTGGCSDGPRQEGAKIRGLRIKILSRPVCDSLVVAAQGYRRSVRSRVRRFGVPTPPHDGSAAGQAERRESAWDARVVKGAVTNDPRGLRELYAPWIPSAAASTAGLATLLGPSGPCPAALLGGDDTVSDAVDTVIRSCLGTFDTVNHARNSCSGAYTTGQETASSSLVIRRPLVMRGSATVKMTVSGRFPANKARFLPMRSTCLLTIEWE